MFCSNDRSCPIVCCVSILLRKWFSVNTSYATMYTKTGWHRTVIMGWNAVNLMEMYSLSFLDESGTTISYHDNVTRWTSIKVPTRLSWYKYRSTKPHTSTARFKLTNSELNRYQNQNVNLRWNWYAHVCSIIFFLIHEILCCHHHCPMLFHPLFFLGIVDINLYHTLACDVRAHRTKYSWINLYSDII